MLPAREEAARLFVMGVSRTGPIKSGINMTSRAMFTRMKKNPIRVTMFGASHSGMSSTNAFHYPDILAHEARVTMGYAVIWGNW